MMKLNSMKRASLGTAIAALLASSLAIPAAGPAMAQPTAVRPTNDVTLSVGTGRMVKLDAAMSDLFVANDAIADVQVRSAKQVYIFGKAAGETTVFATDKSGRTVYSANVRVGTNIGSVDELLHMAMPEAQITARPINGMVLLTGTVAAPADVEEATRIVQAYVGEGTKVISRLKTATPLQVMLQVKIAEVSRDLVREIGTNIESFGDSTDGIRFFGGRGRDFVEHDEETGAISFLRPAGNGTLGAFGSLFGLNIAGALDANENKGLVTTLAEPNLTALSGETASFLAGGEFPIATTSINGTEIEYKQYGVSLAFTPTVLEGGRISMRVRPEVSELSTAGAIRLDNFNIPGLTVRRTETTVELGSGQSLMIGGLLRNQGTNSVERLPGLGNLPIIGALFRSNSFKRNETELVIVVTPYLVRPVNAGQIVLPTDGFRSAKTGERVFLDKQEGGVTGERRPGPVAAPPRTAAPGVAALSGQPAPAPAAPAPRSSRPDQATLRSEPASATPGFSF
jgi:pilus assembly protein CpaC